MNKSIIKILLATLCAPLSLQAFSQQDKFADAVKKVYDEELKEQPDNYNVLFRRAHLYYGQNQYNQALRDIDRAILLMPKSDDDLLVQAYSLRGNIYLIEKDYKKAVDDFSLACQLNPYSYSDLYQKANAEYLYGDYDAAKSSFQRLQRIDNRSLEALIGLARVAVKQQNLGLANEYVDQAVAIYPSNPEAYIRRASVRQQLGNMQGAADDYIMAMAVDSKNAQAISGIVNLARTDYNAVIGALSSAAAQAPDNGLYIYVRGVIQQAHFHYLQAIADYEYLINNNIYDFSGLHASLAECHYYLCDFSKALDEINRAIGTTDNNAEYYIVRSKIRLAMGDDVNALESAIMSLDKNPNSNGAIVQKGLCNISMRKFQTASDCIGEALVTEPENARLLLLRAWILQKELRRPAEANIFLDRIIDGQVNPFSPESLIGFAHIASGDNAGAIARMDSVLAANVDVDGLIHYLACALYSQAGLTDKAIEMMQISLGKGYANLYAWTMDNESYINVSPLRGNSKFDELLSKHSFLFKR